MTYMFLWKILTEILHITITDLVILYLKDYLFCKNKIPKQEKLWPHLIFAPVSSQIDCIMLWR